MARAAAQDVPGRAAHGGAHVARPGLYQRVRAIGVRVNRHLSEARSFSQIKRVTLIAYGTTLIVSVLLLTAPLMQRLPKFQAGDVVQADFKALMDLRIADIAETDRLKKNAHDRERLAFDRDAQTYEKIQQQLKTELTWIIRTVSESKTLKTPARIALLLERMPFLKSGIYRVSDITGLLSERKLDLIEAKGAYVLEKAFNESGFLMQPVSAENMSELIEKGAQIRTINTTKDVADLVWAAEQIQDGANALKLVLRDATLKDTDLAVGTMRLLLTRVRQLMAENPSLAFNPQYTELRRRLAAEKVTAVSRLVKRGTILLRAGDVIDGEKLALVEQVRENHRRRNGSQFLGILLVMGVLAVSISYFTFRFAYEQVRDLGSHVILHGLLWLMFAVELLILVINPLRAYEINFVLFVPFGFFGILIGQFFGARIALSAGIFLAIFSYILAGFDNQSLMVALTSAIAGLYASTRMEKRTQMFKGGVIIAIANFAVVSGFELMAPQTKNYELKVAAVTASSILSVLLTLGILPLIEFIFNLPTPFRLMELNDFNHPLLTRMAAIAPSTHSHSVMLANLSEVAVRALGGDTLLTRVGCLFHDIGKMAHPDFYAENRHLYPTSETFRKLGPLKSAQMIIRHVTDGILMARENRLPEKVISFIPEHHGTTTIQFFYHKALEADSAAINRKNFQYPGPRPQSRETAVAMIADSVEAASRTAVAATKEEFAQIIDRIIENKISEEQFHESPLTLGDLAIVRKAFLDVLVSTYHERPQYPTMQETNALEGKHTAGRSVPKKRSASKKPARKPAASRSRMPELID